MGGTNQINELWSFATIQSSRDKHKCSEEDKINSAQQWSKASIPRLVVVMVLSYRCLHCLADRLSILSEQGFHQCEPSKKCTLVALGVKMEIGD